MNLAEIRELVSKLRIDELEERRIITPLLLRRVIELEAEVECLNKVIDELRMTRNSTQIGEP